MKAPFTLWLCLVFALALPSSGCSPGRAGSTDSPVHVAPAGAEPEAPATPSSADQMKASAGNLLDQGRTAYEAGDYARAIELATQWIGRQPESAEGYYLRGFVVGWGQHDYERAATDLAEVNRLAPDFADAWGARGWYLILLGRWEEAREVTAKAQALAPDDYAWSVNLGHTYLLQGDQETAHRWYRNTLPLVPNEEALLAGPMADFELFIERGWKVAAAQEERDWFQQAWGEYQQTISTVSEDDQWDKLHKQALKKYQAGEYAAATGWAEKALTYAREHLGKRHLHTLASMNNLAALYEAQGRYDEAEPLYVETLALSKDVLGKKHPNTLISMNNLANLYRSQGRYEAAEPLYVEALASNKKVLGEQHPNTLTSMNNLALLYKSQGRYEAAESLYVESLELSKDVLGEQHPKTLGSMNNLANLYRSQGRYEAAEPLYVEALASNKKVLGEKHPRILASMNNLALLYVSQGRYEEAESLYVETLELSKDVLGEQHPDTLGSMNNLANLYVSQWRYEAAESLYVETLELSKRNLGEQHPATLTSMNNLAALYQAQGRYEAAETLFVESLELSKDVLGEQHPATLTSMSNLANLYNIQGRYEAAESLSVETLALTKAVLGETHPATLTSMNNLALLYLSEGRYEQAEAVSDEALSATQAFLMQVLWAAGEKTRASYIQQQMTNTNFYFFLFSRRATGDSARRALALSLNRKALLLQIATQIRAVSRSVDDPALKALASALEDNRQRLAALILSGKADPADIDALEKTVNQQQAALGRQVQQLGRSSEPVSPEQVVAALDHTSVFVDFLVYRPYMPQEENKWQAEHLLALVVSNQEKAPIRIVGLGELAPVRQVIAHYRDHLQRPRPLTAEGKASARQLYEALWSPLLPYLDGKHRVYLAPDGVLNLLPFASLIDDKGHYLLESTDLIMLSSGRDLVLPPLQAKVTAPVVLAAPLYDASQAEQYEQYAKAAPHPQATTTARAANALYFSPLPGALKEGDALVAQLAHNRQSARYYKLAAATEPTVAAVQSPRILHLATHGFFLADLPSPAAESGLWQQRGAFAIGEPAAGLPPPATSTGNPLLRSGLALVDANLAIQAANDEKPGILTAEEVLDLQLAGTQLVVLSACETGVGEIQTGEGVYGLRRAFQEAGAQSVLSTLWSISDAGTQHFMDRFYQRFLAGVPPQQALRETQLEFMQSDNWNSPFYWAPFVMVGTE